MDKLTCYLLNNMRDLSKDDYGNYLEESFDYYLLLFHRIIYSIEKVKMPQGKDYWLDIDLNHLLNDMTTLHEFFCTALSLENKIHEKIDLKNENDILQFLYEYTLFFREGLESITPIQLNKLSRLLTSIRYSFGNLSTTIKKAILTTYPKIIQETDVNKASIEGKMLVRSVGSLSKDYFAKCCN